MQKAFSTRQNSPQIYDYLFITIRVISHVLLHPHLILPSISQILSPGQLLVLFIEKECLNLQVAIALAVSSTFLLKLNLKTDVLSQQNETKNRGKDVHLVCRLHCVYQLSLTWCSPEALDRNSCLLQEAWPEEAILKDKLEYISMGRKTFRRRALYVRRINPSLQLSHNYHLSAHLLHMYYVTDANQSFLLKTTFVEGVSKDNIECLNCKSPRVIAEMGDCRNQSNKQKINKYDAQKRQYALFFPSVNI